MLLASGLGIAPMTLDLDVICISGVPMAGIAAFNASSGRQLILGNDEFVGLAGADHELAFPATDNFADDGALKESMPQPFDNDPFEMRECLGGLAALDARRFGENWNVTHCAAAPSCP
jgi:hypothetical protein